MMSSETIGSADCTYDSSRNMLQAVWRIPDYKSISNRTTRNSSLSSPIFGRRSLQNLGLGSGNLMRDIANAAYNCNWHLALHPHGSRRSYSGFVSLYLYNDDDLSERPEKKWPVIQINMKMVRTYEKMTSVYQQEHGRKEYSPLTGGFGFHHFIARQYLLDEDSCFIGADGSLSVTLVLTHLPKKVEEQDVCPDRQALSILSCNMRDMYRHISQSDGEGHITGSQERMSDSPDDDEEEYEMLDRRTSSEESMAGNNSNNNRGMSDVTFQIDGRRLSANKFMLSARSPVFAAMFRSEMSETTSSVILIEDVEFEVMRAILKYIYCGDIDEVIDENSLFVVKLFVAADKYELQYLRDLCEWFIANNLTPETVAAAMIAGHLHNSPVIKQECFKLVATLDVKQLEDWPEVHRLPGLVDDMLSFWHSNGILTRG